MSKEYLEALKRVRYNSSKEVVDDFDIIEKTLIKFDNITKQINDTSSKGAIGLLNKIKDKLDTYTYNGILESLLKAQSLEKENAKYKRVLKILFKKQVDINEIKILISNLRHCDDIERCKRYNASRKVGYKLKQEEFNSIKEYFKNDGKDN